MFIISLLVTLGVYIYIALMISQHKNLIKCVAFAMAHFILSYEVVSVILLWLDVFSFEKAIFTMLAIGISCSFYLYKKGYENSKVNFAVPYIPVIVIMLALPCMIMNRAELFGMGQDEGVYQTEAIAVALGATNVEYKFDEYSLLNTKEEKKQYDHFLTKGTGGFYAYEYSKNLLEKKMSFHTDGYFDAPVDICVGVYHGVHGYAFVLALWACIFGLTHMIGMQILICIIAIFIFYYTVEQVEKDSFCRLCYTTLFALSPLILWVSKTTYSEILILLAVSLYLYGLLDNKNNNHRFFLINSGVLYFAVSHIMYLIFTPMFYFVNLYIMKREHNTLFGYSGIFDFVILAVTSYIFSKISTLYFFSNMLPLYVKDLVSANNILSIIYAVTVISAIVTYFIWKSSINSYTLDRMIYSAAKILIGLSIIYTVYHMVQIVMGGNSAYSTNAGHKILQTYLGTKSGFMYTSLMAVVLSTGIIILPLTFYKLLTRDRQIFQTNNYAAFSIIFVYMACIFPVFLKKDVFYYMYYARYFVYLIPVILIGFIIYTMDIEASRRLKILLLALFFTMVSALSMVRYKDDTFIQWNALETIVNKVKGNNAVIFMNSATRVALHIKNMAGVGVYPLEEDFAKQKNRLKNFYDNIYILIQDKDKAKDFLTKCYPNEIIDICDIENMSSYFRFKPYRFIRVATGRNDFYLYKINYEDEAR